MVQLLQAVANIVFDFTCPGIERWISQKSEIFPSQAVFFLF